MDKNQDQVITEGKQYRTCEYCGANLDPGEICDCGKKIKPEIDDKPATKETSTQKEQKVVSVDKKVDEKEKQTKPGDTGKDDYGKFIISDSGKKIYPEDESLSESSEGTSAKEMKQELDWMKEFHKNKKEKGLYKTDAAEAEDTKMIKRHEQVYNDQKEHEEKFDKFSKKYRNLNSSYVPYLKSLNVVLESKEERLAYLKHINKYIELNESILDPIHKERCPEIFKDDKMIPSVRKFILSIIEDFKKQVNFPFKINRLLLVGSSTSFQYNDVSDIDVTVETDLTDEQFSEIWKIIPRGTLLPNTNKPVNLFLFKNNEQSKAENAENIYDIENDKWIKQSPRSLTKVPYAYIKDLSMFFMNGCELALSKFERDVHEAKEYMGLDPETMEISTKEKADVLNKKLVDIRNDVDAMHMAHHVIKSFSNEGYTGMPFKVNIALANPENEADPRYSINNLVYKMCDRFNYFTRLDTAVDEGNKLIVELENAIDGDN